MIETLYKKGYLDYKNIILDKYNELDITETEAVVLIKILDIYHIKPNFKVSELVTRTNLKKVDIQKVLYKLSEMGLYITVFKFVNKTEDEFYDFKPLFEKLEIILDDNLKEEAVSLETRESIANLIKETLKRDLTQRELISIESWISTGYTLKQIKTLLKNYPKTSIINFKTIEAKLQEIKVLS